MSAEEDTAVVQILRDMGMPSRVALAREIFRLRQKAMLPDEYEAEMMALRASVRAVAEDAAEVFGAELARAAIKTEEDIAAAVRAEHMRCVMVVERLEKMAGHGIVMADALRRTPPPTTDQP